MSATRPDILHPGQVYGERRRGAAVAGLVLSEVVHGAPRRLPEHEHLGAFFSLVLRGSYREACGGRDYVYRRSAIMYHPEGTRHQDEVGHPGARLFLAELAPEWLARMDGGRAVRQTLGAPRLLAGGPVPGLGLRLYRELLSGDGRSPLVVEGLMLEMLGETVRGGHRRAAAPPSWLPPLLDRLREERAHGWTLAGLAAEIGVGAEELSSAFRRNQGETVGEHLRRLRVELVCERLAADPDSSLADLAALAGFADQSHLTRVFRRLTGTTPGAFQAAARGGARSIAVRGGV